MTAITVNYGTTKTLSETITPVEVFNTTILLPGSASDTSVTLGSLTDPKLLMVYGADDISFKLNADGTDVIRADPVAVIMDTKNGLGITAILLSNGGASEQTVYVYAEE